MRLRLAVGVNFVYNTAIIGFGPPRGAVVAPAWLVMTEFMQKPIHIVDSKI